MKFQCFPPAPPSPRTQAGQGPTNEGTDGDGAFLGPIAPEDEESDSESDEDDEQEDDDTEDNPYQ